MKARTPNFLLLVADQHRWDCVGAAGRLSIRTPNLDRLAADGAFFEQAYTPIPVCAPARQALLSGLAPDELGALWNPDFLPTPTLAPDDGFYTAVLAQAGYCCSLVGKWNTSLTHQPADFGFTHHIDYSGYNSLLKEKYPDLTYRNGWFGEPSPVALEDSKTHWAAREACSLIEASSRRSEPWLVRVDFSDPHLPCHPSEPFASSVDPDGLEPWDSFGDTLDHKPYIQRQQIINWHLEGRSWADWRSTVACYYAMVGQIDDAVGLMLNKLDELGLRQDTVVIYTTDHGDLCGGHGMLDKHYVLYDDVTRVPLIIRWPAQIAAGQRIPEYVSSCLDIGATIGSLSGLPDVKPGHGRSLAPLLQGTRQPERDFAVCSGNGQQFGLYTQRSIRTAEWLYVWNLTDHDELYDVGKDPGQKINRADRPELQDVIHSLRRRLHAELIRRGDPFARSGWLEGQLLENRKI
ncbi:MAG: sulfatase-like hydrolase/transferase [Clostridiaceae bacterium]|nr:sulfatase-like hydrolase/transferase [Clostridiaceae bacterium]